MLISWFFWASSNSDLFELWLITQNIKIKTQEKKTWGLSPLEILDGTIFQYFS
jgi:hypothetical protein